MPDENENQTNPTENPETDPNNPEGDQEDSTQIPDESEIIEETLDPVTQIIQTRGNKKFTVPLGVQSGKYVQLLDNYDKDENDNDIIVNFTLDDFYRNFKDFRDNGHFAHWDIASPTEVEAAKIDNNIKIWYNTEWQNS